MNLIKTETTKHITKEMRQIVKNEGRQSDTLKKRWLQLTKQGYMVFYTRGGKNENVTVFEKA